MERHAKDYLTTMHPDCMMAFAPPVGIIAHDEVIASLAGVRRWRDVALTGQSLMRPSEDVSVLGYHVWARRDGQVQTYSAICTSTYIADGGVWRMMQHQQTPD